MDGETRSTGRHKKDVDTAAVGRRFWSSLEEDTLLGALEDIQGQGWQANDGAFKGGYMGKLEKMLQERLPGCGLHEKHIRSKLTVWKKQLAHCQGVLKSSGGVGMYWDSQTGMIIAEDKVWDDYCLIYKDAKQLRGKPQPHYERWVKIFGGHRATGEEQVDVADCVNELLNKEPYMVGLDSVGETSTKCATEPNLQSENSPHDDVVATSQSPPSNSEGRSKRTHSSTKKRKAKESNADIDCLMDRWIDRCCRALGDVAGVMSGGNGSNISNELCKEKIMKTDLYEALQSIPDLSLDQLVWLTKYLSNNESDMLAFWGMPLPARSRFVQLLLTDGLNKPPAPTY